MNLYDSFDGRELDRGRWRLEIPDTVHKKDVSTELKDELLYFKVKKTIESKGPYDWEGPRIVATKDKFSGINAKLGLDFKNSKGTGNVYIEGVGNEFGIISGIDYQSKDIFCHVFDVNTWEYAPGGRIHHKDHFSYSNNPEEPELVELGLSWEEDGFSYSIEEVKYPFHFPERLGGSLDERLIKDSREIVENGLKEACIKVDLHTPSKKEPSSITALVDEVLV